MSADRAKSMLAGYLLGEIRLEDAAVDREEFAGEDPFGNPGLVILEQFTARGLSPEDRGWLADAYLKAGYTELPRDSHRDDDLVRFRRDELDPSNPFLWENEVQIGIGGRTLMGAQRDLLVRKAAALEEELSSPRLAERRRRQATAMLRELQAGLLPRVSVNLTRRSFRPEPLLTAGERMGDVVSLGHRSQLVYTVMPADPSDRDEGDGDPMYLTILGVDQKQAAFLFSGGLHGVRTAVDLEDGRAHHAWFKNRRAEETADTAPWISRSRYRELVEEGSSDLIVRRERDLEPIRIERTGETIASLRVDGTDREVPVLTAATEKDDRFVILADPASPLVLSLEEAEAELLRTIEEIRTLPA